MSDKYCINCKHHRDGNIGAYSHFCAAARVKEVIHPVTGSNIVETRYLPCGSQRMYQFHELSGVAESDYCGPDGRLFEPISQ